MKPSLLEAEASVNAVLGKGEGGVAGTFGGEMVTIMEPIATFPS